MQTRNWIQGDNGLLRKTSLWGANLANAPLVGANLSETQLNYSILKMAKMINADLTQASLQEVDLSNADLYHCNLQDCDMQNAILHKTMLVGVNLSGANLRNAKLSEIIWVREHSNYKTILPDETVVDSHTTLNMERFTNPSHELFEVTLNKINLIRQKRGIHPIPNEDFLIV